MWKRAARKSHKGFSEQKREFQGYLVMTRVTGIENMNNKCRMSQGFIGGRGRNSEGHKGLEKTS